MPVDVDHPRLDTLLAEQLCSHCHRKEFRNTTQLYNSSAELRWLLIRIAATLVAGTVFHLIVRGL